MASLALGLVGSFVGGLIGGPIGANLGWMLGAALGNALDPQKIEGPRLSDLRLQGSSYGRSIPLIYGTKRVAGNVIWQTDLTEHQSTSGGKGGPEVTSYTYTASFAVLLCEGPIGDVTRVWADGRLVYDRRPGAELSAFPFTIYLGTETQDVDPTMEGVLGVGNVPAHRGTAYVVFDEIDLAAYGQRIPNLEFEVVSLSHTNAAMNQTAIDSDHSVIFKTNTNGKPYCAIQSWPIGGSDKIRVIELGSSTVHEYNQDLTYSGAVTRTIDDAYPLPYNVDGYWYQPIGSFISGGVPLNVYVNIYAPMDADPSLPALAGIGNPGIPAGEWIGGGCLTADRTGLFLFTGPTAVWAGAVADKWYLVEDGVVVDSGTINPAKSTAALACGNSVNNSASEHPNKTMSAENGRRWIWFQTGASVTHGGECAIYYIDDAGNMALDATVGIEQVNGDVADLNARGSSLVIADGYLGVAVGQTLCVMSRFPVGDSLYAPLADIVEDISIRAGLTAGQVNVTGLDDLVQGYVIPGQMSARAAIEPLQAAYFFDPVESDGTVKFIKRGGASVITIDDDDLAAYSGSDPPPLLTTVRQQEIELPRAVDVVYVNSDADYQEGSQRAIRQGTSSQSMTSISVPIVLTDTEAKAIADRTLYAAWQEREKFRFSTSRKFAKYEPTDIITASGRAVRVLEKTETAGGVIEWTGVAAIASATFVQGSVPGTGEGFVPQAPPSIQGTVLRLIDLPLMSDSDAASGFYAVMCGAIDTNWRGATLFKSVDSGVNYLAVTSNSTADRIGQTTTTLGDWVGGNWFDECNTVTVELTPGSAALTSSSELGVLNGANMCVIGSEVLQYKTATLISLRTYVLSGLLRGRRGTEWTQASHATGDLFAALPASVNVDAEAAEIGLSRLYKAVTSGLALDVTGAVTYANAGLALTPFSPCQIGGGRDGSGNLTINWCRRSRYGGDGMLDVDPIVGEPTEWYTITIYATSGYATAKRTITAATTTASYTSAQQTTDFGGNQSTVYLTISQLGARGSSYAKRGTV